MLASDGLKIRWNETFTEFGIKEPYRKKTDFSRANYERWGEHNSSPFEIVSNNSNSKRHRDTCASLDRRVKRDMHVNRIEDYLSKNSDPS